MTAAQKKAKDNFKKAIAYRKKCGCSLKEAFAHVYGKKVGAIKKKSASKKKATKKAAKKAAPKKKTSVRNYGSHKDTNSHNVKISVVSGFFDTTVIKDLDTLKKQYFKLSKLYHPDAGGTKEQFQNLQVEYKKLLKNILEGSNLSSDQKKNEIEIDEAIRNIVDSIINLNNINIELIGKWLWISGNTYAVRSELKKAGLIYIKKDGISYWVYKGSESRGRGKLTIDEIKKKYGSRVMTSTPQYKIGDINTKNKFNKNKFGINLRKLVKHINKRPI